MCGLVRDPHDLRHSRYRVERLHAALAKISQNAQLKEQLATSASTRRRAPRPPKRAYRASEVESGKARARDRVKAEYSQRAFSRSRISASSASCLDGACGVAEPVSPSSRSEKLHDEEVERQPTMMKFTSSQEQAVRTSSPRPRSSIEIALLARQQHPDSGMRICFTSESTILPNAAPMIRPLRGR